MHEYGVAADIVTIASGHAEGKRLKTIRVEVGALSGVYGASLEMFLGLVLKERDMPGVTAELTAVPARFRCTCGQEYEPEQIYMGCPACGGFDRETVAGNECMIKTIEVEDD